MADTIKLEMQVTEEQLNVIRDAVRKEIEEEITDKKLAEYLKTTRSISIQHYICQYGVYSRAEELGDKKVKDLSDHEKLILALRWMLFDSIGRR